MRSYIASLLLILAPMAGAEEIVVGGQPIKVPAPDGFTNLLPSMAPYYESNQAYISPTNIRFVSLIPADAAAQLESGNFTTYSRFMNIETERNISARNISAEQFDDIRDVLRTQLDELIASAEQKMPGFIDAGDAKASATLNADVDISVGDLVPLPVHYDTANAIAYTMFMSVAGEVDGRKQEAEITNVTMLALLVRERVLFLYVYGNEGDVDWTRGAAAAWADAILAANDNAADAAGAQHSDDTGDSIWSNKAREAAIVVVAVLFMIWLIRQVAVKRKRGE